MAEDPNERHYYDDGTYIEDDPEYGEWQSRRSRDEERQLDALYRAQAVVWFFIGLLVALIALRFILLALGANLNAGFGALLFALTQPFVGPFLPLFNEQQVQIQFGSLVAIFVYLLIGWGISRLLEILLAPSSSDRDRV